MREGKKKFKVLSPEETNILIEKIKDGNKSAKDKLITSNLNFIRSVVRKYDNCKFLQFHDLLQAGTLGLLRAIESFDSTKGNTFLTYAVYWIKSFIIKEIKTKENTIFIPIGVQEETNRELKKETSDLSLSADSHHVMSIKHISPFESINTDKLNYSDYISDKNAISPEHSIKDDNTIENLVKNVFDGLPDLERIILEHSFGINKEYVSMKDLSTQLGISTGTIRKLKEQAIFRVQMNKEIGNLKETYMDFLETAV